MTPTAAAPVHQCGALALTVASATNIGGRDANADAAATEVNPFGVGATIVDGIGSRPEVVAAARRAADTAAVVASHKGALSAIMAAADTMPDYPGAPNGVAAAVSVQCDGRIEIAHVGDTAIWTWSRSAGLTRCTVDQTAGQHLRHMLHNPALTPASRTVLEQHGEQVVAALDDYVLNGLAYATVSTISWTPLRGRHTDVDVLLLTSDGVHKRLPDDRITALIAQHAGDAQALADVLVETSVSTPCDDPDEAADNATAVVITVTRTT